MKNKIIICILILLVIILIGATIFSISKFSVINPVSSCFGMIEILFTDKQYTIVQNYPRKVAFSKTGDTSNKTGGELLDEYMKSRGFNIIPEKQMGAEIVYSNGVKVEHIIFTTNKYYSKWMWV